MAVEPVYGLAPQPEGTYEVDHLVSLELGGSNDITNLWPEAASPAPGFHQKDSFENYLHSQVCSGQVALADAQTAIATDWLGAWYAAGQPGGNTIASLPNPTPTTIPAAVLGNDASDGHTYYASSASNARDIYCDTDSGWQRLSLRNLVSFPSLAAAMAALPAYHLHQPC